MDTTGIVFYIKKVKAKEKNNSKDIFSGLRRNLTKAIMREFSEPANGIASALLTGDKTAIKPEIRDKFINSGTAHVLAISGLHMSILVSILFFLFSKILLYLKLILHRINHRKISAILTIPLAYVYLALSGFSPSAIRAFLMTSVCLISIILGRGALSMRSISTAALLILLFDSSSLFLVSFQLSFAAVVALISFYQNNKDRIPKYIFKDNFFGKSAAYIFASIITTLIATLATTPISSATFNRFSASGVLGNLIAIPLVSFIIAPLGIFSLFFSSFCKQILTLLEYFLNILINTVGFISEIPGSDIAIRSPHNSTLYIGIFGGIIYFLLKTKLKYCGIFMIISSLILYSFEENPNIIFAPGIDTPCYIEDGKFYAPSKRKGWRKFISIQRNLGFSGELEKMELEDCLVERKKYENGLFIWSKNGKIIRKCQIAQRLHPYCPAFFEDLD